MPHAENSTPKKAAQDAMGKLKATEFGIHVAVWKSLFPGWSISLLKLRGALRRGFPVSFPSCPEHESILTDSRHVHPHSSPPLSLPPPNGSGTRELCHPGAYDLGIRRFVRSGKPPHWQTFWRTGTASMPPPGSGVCGSVASRASRSTARKYGNPARLGWASISSQTALTYHGWSRSCQKIPNASTNGSPTSAPRCRTSPTSLPSSVRKTGTARRPSHCRDAHKSVSCQAGTRTPGNSPCRLMR